MMELLRKIGGSISRRKKAAIRVMSMLTVFIMVYSLILPALTIDQTKAEAEPGMYLEEDAPGEVNLDGNIEPEIIPSETEQKTQSAYTDSLTGVDANAGIRVTLTFDRKDLIDSDASLVVHEILAYLKPDAQGNSRKNENYSALLSNTEEAIARAQSDGRGGTGTISATYLSLSVIDGEGRVLLLPDQTGIHAEITCPAGQNAADDAVTYYVLQTDAHTSYDAQAQDPDAELMPYAASGKLQVSFLEARYQKDQSCGETVFSMDLTKLDDIGIAVTANAISDAGETNETNESGMEDGTVSDGSSADDAFGEDVSAREDDLNADAQDTGSDLRDDADDFIQPGIVAQSVDDVITDSEAEADQAYDGRSSGTLRALEDGYEVAVSYDESARLPEGVTLSVRKLDENSREYGRLVDRYHDANQNNAIAEAAREQVALFDITLQDAEGRELEPAAPVQVSIRMPELAEVESEDVKLVHFTGAVHEVEGELANDTLSFEAESFSVYGVVYTVDFQWEVDGKTYEFSISGGGFISLTELVETLGIAATEEGEELTPAEAAKAFVADVERVEFSDPSLLSVNRVEENTTVGAVKNALGLVCEYSAELTDEKIAEINARRVRAGDWTLISLKAFDTEESLTVTMKTGEVFSVKVSDAQISKDDVQDNQGYIVYTIGNDNNYYVLKTDGTTERFDNANGFDELTNEYKWAFTHVYTEDDVDRFNIRTYNDRSRSLTLNNPGQSLVGSGANNVTIVPNEDGYTFEGYNGTLLSLSGSAFAGTTSVAARVYIYEQAPLSTYKLNVTVNDYNMGKVGGYDTLGVSQINKAEYQTTTSQDKKNKYTIKADPQSEKYKFDHWLFNGQVLYDEEDKLVGSTINPETLDIPYNGSTLEAVFTVNPEYNPPDDQKDGRGYNEVSKQALRDWLNELKNRQVPLDSDGCTKTAEVYDYENRIYRVDLTAKSSLSTFDGIVDLGFVIDASGSMQFPSKLTSVSGKESFDINHINDNDTTKNQLDHNQTYYLIADKAGTATVYQLWYNSETEYSWYGSTTRTGWWAVDASYARTDNRRFFIGTGSKFSNDNAGMKYQIYTDGDLKTDSSGHTIDENNDGQPDGYKRLDYLQSSINGTKDELNNILSTLSMAKNSSEDPDVKLAYNTFCASILHQQHEFTSVKNGFNIQWDTNGGTGTDLALRDAKDFAWGTNKSTKNYAILITDGAPQANGKAIANSTVISAANELKAGQDKISGTDDDVTLITVGLSMGDVKRGSVLLYDLADRDSNNEKLFFKAESGDELEYVLYEIIQKILVDATVQGDVTDKVGEAFYPVDKATGKPLAAGDKIDLEGNKVDASYEGPCGVLDSDLATIHWTNQNFTKSGWHGTVYVKAKEDLLGGNAVRTNDGNAVIEAKSYQTPSMTKPVELKADTVTTDKYVTSKDDLKSPLVNVNELQFGQNETEWTVYLGTEVEPEKQLEALYKKILVEETVTKAVDKEPVIHDDLPDHVLYEGADTDNNLYPLKESISDKRESEITDGKKAVTFTMNDLLKKLVEGENYEWWNYSKGEPNYKKFFETASTGEGITLEYDVYGLNDMEHHLKDGTTKHDGSTINIKFTKAIEPGEVEAGTDPLDRHETKLIGEGVEKYTLTILYSPDYDIVPEGQGGKSIEDFHTGTYETMYQGHAAGTETSKNEHVINVYAKPLLVKKTDPEGNKLPGAKFAVYRKEKAGETNGTEINNYNESLTGEYVLVSEGTADGNGVVVLANTGTTAETRLVPGETYYLIETKVPSGGYVRDKTLREITVNAQENGNYSDLSHNPMVSLTEGEPYNWSQGVRILVDGKAVVVDAPETDTQKVASSPDRDLPAAQYIHKSEEISFVTKIINLKQTVNMDVTKSWVDGKNNNKAQLGHSVTFKVTKKAGEQGTAEVVCLRGHITATDAVQINDDGTEITLKYQEGTGWPVASITGLNRYTDESGETEWIYEITEIICNPEGKADPEKAKYEISESNGKLQIKIVNTEKTETQIEIDKKWYGSTGQELQEAPENSITFELYRVAHIPCRHVWNDGEVKKKPSCEETGIRLYTCTKCSETKEETIPANGHSWGDWTVKTPATYAADGEEHRICSVCGKEETRPITKLPHDHVWDDVKYDAKPTCEGEGTAHRKCSLCGKVEEATFTVPALGHHWNAGETITPATCEGTGVKKFTCTVCGKTEIRTIQALGHDYVVTAETPATCESAGSRHYVCRNDETHTKDETLPALGHNYGPWETYIEATETTDGENRSYCLNDSSHYMSQVVPKTGETYKDKNGNDTGIPVNKYDWPTSPPEGKTTNDSTTVEPTGLIKYTAPNGTVSYAIVYKKWSGNYDQLLQGPGGSAMQNEAVVLTGTIKTSANMIVENNGNSKKLENMSKGDMYKDDDGTFYVYLKNDNTANNLQNGFSSGDWYKVPGTPVSNSDSGTNGTNAANPLSATRVHKSASVKSISFAKPFASAGLLGADPNGEATQTDPNAERKERIAALTGKTSDKIIFRSELGEQSNVDAWEFVKTFTGSGTDWHWIEGNLDAYDEDGNEYTYYVVETSPSESIYEITYDNNGVKESSAGKTITINNKRSKEVKVTLDILKIEKDNPAVTLPGATFTLREINEVVNASEPSYKDNEDSGISKTTVSGGTLSFDNIGIGYYEIRETNPPQGYVVLDDTVCYIRVTSEGVKLIKLKADKSGWDEICSDGNFSFAAASGSTNAKMTVQNEPGAALPNTGGSGTFPLYILGSVLLMLSGTGLSMRRKHAA